MLKIAYVINYIVKNGPSSVVLNIINNLDRTKLDVSLITLFEGNNPEVVEQLKSKNVAVYECISLSRMKCLCGMSKEFTEIVKKGKFDVLHTHGLIPDILASRLKFPVKVISTIHNNMYEDYLDSYGYIKSHIFISFHLSALKKIDKCVCCSKSVYEIMKQHLKNISYIRNGIELAQVHSIVTREMVNVPEKARLFLYAGVLNSGKNIVWLIQNFVKYHNDDEYLLVLGQGEKEIECKEAADDHVRMLGFQSDPIAYMKISDVYVSASKSEGFSISILEALSCGLGLLLSNIPSHQEVVEMGKSVYLGEIFSQDGFGTKLEKLRNSQLDKNAIREFQSVELAACGMTKSYGMLYESYQLR